MALAKILCTLLIFVFKFSLSEPENEEINPWIEYKRRAGKSCLLGIDGEEIKLKPPVTTENTPSFESLPDKIDWREQGMVTPPKSQGGCSDCYNFAAVGAIESANAIAGYPLTNLSEQQYLDCEKHDCAGGTCIGVIEYAKKDGLMSASDYPYHPDKIGECKLDKSKVVAKVTNDSFHMYMHENDMVKLLENGPFTASIAVQNFQKIKHGHVFKGPCKGVGHAIEVVAFHKHSPEGPYWLIKNSWGPGWKGDGYAMFQFGANMCSITTQISQAIVKHRDQNY